MQKPAISLKAVTLVLTVVCGIGWLGYADSGGEGVVEVQLRDYVFHIPERYSMYGATPFWLKWMLEATPGLDRSSPMTRFTVPNEEVSQALPAYRFRPNGDFTAVLGVLSDEEVARYQDPEWGFHGDMWYGRRAYKDRVIEPFGETGWYRMYLSPAKVHWDVVRQYPDASMPPPNDPLSFDVARCHNIVGVKTTSCLTYAFSGRIAIDFWTTEENLVLIDELRAFLMAKVLEWKQPDQRTGSAPDL